jgi:hypothetical protein
VTLTRDFAEREMRESPETAVEDDGEEKTYCVIKWFVKCSNKLYNQNPSISHAHPQIHDSIHGIVLNYLSTRTTSRYASEKTEIIKAK